MEESLNRGTVFVLVNLDKISTMMGGWYLKYRPESSVF